MPPRKPILQFLLISVALVALVGAVSWPVVHYDFIGFDDPQYVTKNARVLGGLTWENVRWAFSSTYASNWHPLTWISHMVDVQFFGATPGPQHLSNLLLHALNTCLVFAALRALTGAVWRSAFVAALFGVHPMHVESVAWIAERKDVLSTFFGLLAMLFYAWYCDSRYKPANAPVVRGRTSATLAGPRNWAWYVLSLACFALSLMSKPMLVTLPFVLLLLDFWPLNRLRGKQNRGSEKPVSWLILEKLPYLLLSTGSSIIAYLAQSSGGSVETLERVPFFTRLINAVIGYALYFKHVIWPVDLAILYLRPVHWPVLVPVLSAVVLLALTGLALAFLRARPYVAVGWFWFVGTLVPVIGLVQVGNQIIADRYTYFPYIGLFIVLAWGGFELAMKLRGQKLAPLLGLAVVLVSSAAAAHQVRFWRNTETLFNHCLAVTKDNFVAHNILAASLDPQTRFEDAKAHFEAALQVEPRYVDAQRNLGVLLTDHGDYHQALSYLDKATASHPELGSVYAKLALLLDNRGQTEGAILYYRRALTHDSNDLQCLNNLAWILATHADAAPRNAADAVTFAGRACDLTQNQQAPLLGTLAAAYAEAGDFTSATAAAQKAIAIADARGEQDLAARNRQLVELYRVGKPYHESR